MSSLSKKHFQEEEFIRKNSLQCSLFIQLANHICRLLILDSENKIRLAEEIETTSFLAKEWTFSNLKFAKTSIHTLPESFIFVPDELELKDSTPFAPFLTQDKIIFQQTLESHSICTHFTINETASLIQQQFSKSEIFPSANGLIQYMLSTANDDGEFVGINFYEKEMELAFIKKKQFIFYNRFIIENADDFNFYLLSIFEQFEIQVAHAQFYLTGTILENDEHYQRLSKYSSHLHFIKNEAIDFSFLEMNPSQEFFLLTQASQ